MFEDFAPQPLPKPTSAQLRLVHQTCERFERAWRQGQSLTIEQLLSESTKEIQPYLLEALVRSEIELLDASGSQVDPQQYLRRFAKDSGIIARVFMTPDKLDQLDSGDAHHSVHSDFGYSDPTRPDRLGQFEIRGEIGSGGMGVVYRGWHEVLQREVAIKCIRRHGQLDDKSIERFRREAKTVAALSHEAIVPIYEVGNDQGVDYFVMPLVNGESLSARINREPLANRELAHIVQQVALATQYAHDHGIVHRDLKPPNILIDKTGKVWVTDFGLAKSLQAIEAFEHQASESAEFSATQIVGTPAYMAPEQLQGKASERTDVYGLGAVLYTGLTGRPPHRAATLMETLQQIKDSTPVAPRTLDPQIPADLETITLKALNKDPASRYASAKALADDLTRYLEGRPILAKAASTPERIWRWMKREPLVASLTIGLITALTIGLCISLWFYSEAVKNAAIANQSAETARETVKRYLTDVAQSPELSDQGQEVLRSKLLTQALQFYEELARQSPDSLALQLQIAEAHQQMALIHKALGDDERALKQYQEMEAAYEKLAMQYPGKTEYLLAMIEATTEQAQIHSEKTRADTAAQLIAKGMQRCEKLLQSQPHSLPAKIYLAALTSTLAEHHSNAGDGDKQAANLAQATKLCQEIIQSPVTEIPKDLVRRLATSLDRLALHLQVLGQLEPAEQFCKLGVQLCADSTGNSARDSQTQFIEARLHKNLYSIYIRSRQMPKAEAEFDLANNLLNDLRSKHPLVLAYLDAHVVLLSNQSVVLYNQGKPSQARELIEQTIPLQQQLIARQYSLADSYGGLSNMYGTLGAILRSEGELAESENVLKLGLQANTKMQELTVSADAQQYFRINLTNSLAETYLAQHREAEAVQQLQSVAADADELFRKSSTNLGYTLVAASVFRNFAVGNRRLNHFEAASAAAEKAISIFEKVPAQMSAAGPIARILTDSLFTQAHCYFAQSKFSQASENLDRTITLVNKIIDSPATDPASGQLMRTTRGEYLDLQGQIAAAQDQHQPASELFEKALADQQSALVFFKDNASKSQLIRELFAPVHIHYAQSLMQLKKWPEALKACDTALELKTGSAVQAEELKNEILKARDQSKD